MKRLILVLLLIKCSASFSQEKFNVIVDPVTNFSENFSSNYKNWPQAENESVGLKIIDGEFHLMAGKSNIILPQKINASLSNKNRLWRLSAEVTYIDGKSSFGIFFGTIDSPNTYAYMINGMGDYFILKINGGQNKVLAQGKSSKINIGKGAKNILSIETDNDYLYNYPYTCFNINGSNVRRITKAEEKAIEDKKPKEADGTTAIVQFTKKDIDDMMKDLEVSRIDPEVGSNGKIGLILSAGVAAKYDNIMLETKPNRGRMIMYNNKWAYNPEFSKYLAKNIALEEETERAEVLSRKLKSEAEDLNRDKAAIAKLTDKQLHPYGNAVAAAKPDIKAVAWLRKIILQMSSPLGLLFTYSEKELISKTDSSEQYKIKHNLPNINSTAAIDINIKKQKGFCAITLAKGISTEAATILCSNYLANLAAAFDVAGNEYYEPQNTAENKDIPRTLLINGSKNYLSSKYVAGLLDVVKDGDGTWKIVLYLIGK